MWYFLCTFAPCKRVTRRLIAENSYFGGLAQLARALAWHARGHRFEPDILHKKNASGFTPEASFFVLHKTKSPRQQDYL